MTKQPSLSNIALVCGIGLTSIGILRVSLLPINAPAPQPMRPDLLVALQSMGWRVSSTVAAKNRRDVSNAEGVTLIHGASSHEGIATQVVEINLTPIRTRSAEQLDADTIDRATNERVIKEKRSFKINNDLFLRFTDKKQRQMATSCIAGGQASSLKDQVKQQARTQAHSWRDRIEKTIGIQPLTDWSCLFMAISVEKNQSIAKNSEADQAISRIWTQLKPIFKEPWDLKRIR